MLSKGWGNLTLMAGTAAQQASIAMKSGTESLTSVMRDGEVAGKMQTNAKVLADRGKELSKQGWSGIRSLYASVASKVETAARENGYNLDLGSSKLNVVENGGRNLGSSQYSRLSRSESDGLDNLVAKNQETDAFQGFEDSTVDQDDPQDLGIHKNSKFDHNLKNSKNSVGSKSGPAMQSKVSKDDWKDWGNSEDDEEEEEEEIDDDWGKW